jgi:catechol 2,3-dioxygenase-like lactoylglutathione lyase family enzyme
MKRKVIALEFLGTVMLSIGFLMLSIGGASAQPPQSSTPIKKPAAIALGSFGHAVANLDTSVVFYRDALGLDLVDETPKPVSDPAFQKLMDTPGAKVRSARFRIPNEPFTIELVEYSNIDRKPARAHHNDPGSFFFNVGYLDQVALVDALRKANTQTVNGAQIAPDATRAGWIRDPDGTMIETMQGGWDPEKKSMNGVRNAFRGHFGITMETYQQALSFYRDLLGFNIQAGFENVSTVGLGVFPKTHSGPGEYRHAGPGMEAGLGVPAGANWTAVEGYCAGARCEMFEFKDAPRTPFRPRPQDPGAGYLSVWVSDLDSLLAKMKTAGIEVVTEGGNPVQMKGSRQILVRDPGGFLVLLMQHDS